MNTCISLVTILSNMLSLGCNMGMGNSAVSQPRVPQVRVRFWNSGPEAVPQPVTAVSRVFAVLSVHCQPKSRSVILSYNLYYNYIQFFCLQIWVTKTNFSVTTTRDDEQRTIRARDASASPALGMFSSFFHFFFFTNYLFQVISN